MPRLFRFLPLLLLPLAPLPAAHAAIDPSIVAADARWMIYLDLNTLRASELGRELTAMFARMQPTDASGGIRLDLQKLLATAGSATAYGTNLTKDPKAMDGTLILQGMPELRTIAEGLVAQMTVSSPDEITELTNMPFEAYKLASGVSIAFPPEPVILVSKSGNHLVKAHEVIRGATSSLAKSPSRLSELLPSTARSYLVAATIVPSGDELFDGNAPQARILRMANSGSVSLGEDGVSTSARVLLIASSDAMADKLMKIVQGMAAIASLAETSDEQLNQFLQSVTVSRSGNAVQLSLAYPTARLVEMVNGMQEREHSSHQHQGRPSQHAPFPDPESGVVVAQWTADSQLPGDVPAPENFATRSTPDVALVRGAIVTVSGTRDGGENARIDYVEFAPAGDSASGSPLRYEAEYMRLDNYRVEKVPFASGGELAIIAGDLGSASFQFQGASGTYRLTVGYVDESDGVSRFALSIREPEPMP